MKRQNCSPPPHVNFVSKRKSENLDPFMDISQGSSVEGKLVKYIYFYVDNLINTENSADKMIPLYKKPVSNVEKNSFHSK